MQLQDFSYEKAYYLLRLIRRTEERIIEVYPTDKVKSPVHLSIGQENIAVGVCSALSDHDVIFSNYRGHAHYIARGGNLKKMWAELYGKKDGHSGGKAGSMHLMDMGVNFVAASAIVASAVPNAVGYAFAKKSRGEEGIVVCFHGEGAVDEGVYWESLNFAALFELPILFICENNGYAMYTPQERRSAKNNIAAKANCFGVQAMNVEACTTKEIMQKTQSARQKILETKKPMLMECMTYRWMEHVGPENDHQKGYRDMKELRRWQEKDDLKNIQKFLDENERKLINQQVELDIQAAIDFAEDSPFPNIEELYTHVYA